MPCPSWAMGVFYSPGDASMLYSLGLNTVLLGMIFFLKCCDKTEVHSYLKCWTSILYYSMKCKKNVGFRSFCGVGSGNVFAVRIALSPNKKAVPFKCIQQP